MYEAAVEQEREEVEEVVEGNLVKQCEYLPAVWTPKLATALDSFLLRHSLEDCEQVRV